MKDVLRIDDAVGAAVPREHADIANALRARNESDKAAVGYIYTLYPILIVAASGSSEGLLQSKRARRVLEAAGQPFMNDEEMQAHLDWLREGNLIDDLLQPEAKEC
ncbi:hypothetical protein B4Q13_19935, partial [Lacticaseibacillus rhamnosus]